MRQETYTLAGEEIHLTANFERSMEIAKRVADPLKIVRESVLEGHFMKAGIPYQPKWMFTIENVVEILYIGSRMPREKLQDLVFEAGFMEAREIAENYLTIIVGPRPETEIDVGEKDEVEPGK